MLKGHPLCSYFKFSGSAALLYLLIACKYILNERHTGIWILYAGNMLFAAVIAAFILIYNGRSQDAVPAGKMVAAGHIAAVMGILISCAGCLLLLLAVTSHVFGNVSSVLFVNAVLGNICAASLISILLPFTLIKVQRGEGDAGELLFKANEIS